MELTDSLGRVLLAGDKVHSYAARHYNRRGVVEGFEPSHTGKVRVRMPSGLLVVIHRIDLERIG